MIGKNMPLRGPLRFLLILGGLAAVAIVLYQIPAINDRLSWRVFIAEAYARGVVDPVKPLPAPQDAADPGKSLPTPRMVQSSLLPTATPGQSAAAATPTLETPAASPTPTLTPTPIGPKAEIPPPPYEKQDINDCGPATLSMYLQFYGWKGSQKDIAAEIKPLREDRNVNVEELVYYARTHAGWLQIEYRVGGDIDLLKKFIAAGIPVMIEESFPMAESYWPNDDRWAGHYLYINGYDDSIQTFKTQDVFVSPNHPVSYQELESHWQAFNHVYILLFPPEQAGTVKSILGDDWDPDHNRQNALEKAQKASEQDPRNAYAWFNLGTNLVYFERYDDAARAYDQARRIGLPQRMLRYQFGPFIAYFHALRTDDLMTLTEYALKITPNSEEDLLWRGWGMYRQGKKADAIDLFNKAIAARPGYADAKYALTYVQSH